MIINSLCNSCLQPYRILIEISDVELIKQISDENGITCKCPRLCGGRINLIGDPTISLMADDPRLKDPLHITGRELYCAVNGLGLPDEIPKSQDIVFALMKANTVEGISIEETNGRLYLHEINLQNGITIHLGSGAFGAQILKITKKRG